MESVLVHFSLTLQSGSTFEQYQHLHPDLVQKLINSFYVDDVVTGAATEEEAFQLYTDSKKILQDGAFNLRKFRTNSHSLQLRIDAAENQSEDPPDTSCNPCLDETYVDTMLGKSHSSEALTVKVLGVIWNPQEDRLYFRVADIAEAAVTMEPTKRKRCQHRWQILRSIGISGASDHSLQETLPEAV